MVAYYDRLDQLGEELTTRYARPAFTGIDPQIEAGNQAAEAAAEGLRELEKSDKKFSKPLH